MLKSIPVEDRAGPLKTKTLQEDNPLESTIQ
jgi:hypothetical protein